MKNALLIAALFIVGVGVLLFVRWGSYGDLTPRAKLSGALLEISGPRSKLAEACGRDVLKPGLTHRELGIVPRSEEWALVRDIAVAFGGPERGSFIATLGPVYDDTWPLYRKLRIEAGSRLAFRVTCKNKQFAFDPDPENTTVPKELLPSSMRVR